MRFHRMLKAGGVALALFVVAGLPLWSAEEKAAAAKKAVASVAHLRLAGDFEEGPAALDPLFGSTENFKTSSTASRKRRKTRTSRLFILNSTA